MSGAGADTRPYLLHQHLLDIADRVIGERLGDLADHPVFHFLVHFLAQFAQYQRRGDEDQLAEFSLVGELVEALGNVTGVASVDEDIAVETKEPDAVFYEVKKGDTLWAISETHYGKGKGGEYNRIFEANKPMLKPPDQIYPGQVLRIPPM